MRLYVVEEDDLNDEIENSVAAPGWRSEYGGQLSSLKPDFQVHIIN